MEVSGFWNNVEDIVIRVDDLESLLSFSLPGFFSLPDSLPDDLLLDVFEEGAGSVTGAVTCTSCTPPAAAAGAAAV